MSEQTNELNKLAAITTDSGLSDELRTKAIELIGNIGTHEALLVLLGVAGNDTLARRERELALKCAREIIKTGR